MSFMKRSDMRKIHIKYMLENIHTAPTDLVEDDESHGY